MINFENDIERDFYAFLIGRKGFKESAASACIEDLRKIQPFKQLGNGCLERTINALKYLLEYEYANIEKYNGWAKAMKNCSDEEINELHRCMRKD